MSRSACIVALLLCFMCTAAMQTAKPPSSPTFSDVLPILHKHCQACHQSRPTNMTGLVAPMPLTTYAEVQPWARAIARAVQSKPMPPWLASNRTKGVVLNERTLSAAQVGYINYAQKADATPSPTAQDALPIHAGHGDAVDADRATRATAAVPGHDAVAIDYPKLLPSDPALTNIGRLAPGAVVKTTTAAIMKLRTGSGLRFGAITIAAPAGYPSTYGMWIKKTPTGWSLVLTTQPDVWGTQYDPTATMAEIPLQYTRVESDTPLNVRVEPFPPGHRIVMTWGSHQWVTNVVVGGP